VGQLELWQDAMVFQEQGLVYHDVSNLFVIEFTETLKSYAVGSTTISGGRPAGCRRFQVTA